MRYSNADKWFSRFIRLRDADDNGFGRCCTCGIIKEVKYMDCGHYVKRQHKMLRFNEMNCQLQCKRCNAFEQGRDVEFRKFLIKKYGEENVLLLESNKKPFKRNSFEIEAIANYYKEKVKALLTEKLFVKWW